MNDWHHDATLSYLNGQVGVVLTNAYDYFICKRESRITFFSNDLRLLINISNIEICQLENFICYISENQKFVQS